MNVVYAPRALRYLQGIAEYMRQRSPAGLLNILTAIKSSVDALAAFPEIGRSMNDFGHRRMPVLRYPYAIFYRIAGNELIVLHIRHTSRRSVDPAADLADLKVSS
jgi:plasmid stabilization system protein ParE